jgi:mono/diheme cytochrome c family protein
VYKTILAMCTGGVLLALAGGLLLLARGTAAKPPGKLETLMMTAAKHQLLVGNKSARNPLPTNSQNILAGKQTFSHYCYVCHGLDGQRTGVPFADAMSPPLPSLTSESAQSYSDGQLFWVIKNGLWPSGMPRANGSLSDNEIWSVVVYIRHLPAGGSLPDPPAYSDKPCEKPSSK